MRWTCLHSCSSACPPRPEGAQRASYLIVNFVSLMSISKGPESYFSVAMNSPLRPLGTRHVCEQVPPQPYSRVQAYTLSPRALKISTFGRFDLPVEMCKLRIFFPPASDNCSEKVTLRARC